MMRVSDYDRQTLAQALRELAEGNGAAIRNRVNSMRVDEVGDYTLFGVGAVLAMDGACLCEAEDASGYLGALADIVEQPTCRNASMKPADVLLCSECGEHVDIAHMESCEEYHARYCPRCGRKVVTDE